MDDRRHRTHHSANQPSTETPAAEHRKGPHETRENRHAGHPAAPLPHRLSRILHDEKGNAVFLWQPTYPNAAGSSGAPSAPDAKAETASAEVESPPVLDALDTGELALETDELYDGDTHNPYMHDHETLRKRKPTTPRTDHHDLAPWLDLVNGIKNDKKRRGG